MLINKSIYTFFAKPVKVIDGETLIVEADLVFFTTVRSKNRLSEINAPDLKTPKGKKAKAFLEKELQNAHLVLETRKKEKYGRYLSNIYYHNEYTNFEDMVRNGKLINEEILKAKLATKYEYQK